MLVLFGVFSVSRESLNYLETSSPTEGLSYIIFGSAAMTTKTIIDVSSSYYPVTSVYLIYRRDVTSRSAVLLEDTNGDGYKDVIVCYPLQSLCYLFFASKETGLHNMPIGATIYSLSSSFFGFAVASVGDMNQDGYSDFIVSALTGKACYVIYGRKVWSSVLRVAELRPDIDGFKIISDDTTSLTGISVAGIDDMNGDGHVDLAISVQRGNEFIVSIVWGSPDIVDNVLLSEVGSRLQGYLRSMVNQDIIQVYLLVV